jgi:hypothetical protein
MSDDKLWRSRLSCGCWTSPVSTDGHPYGRAREGSYISCVDDLRHQSAYRVLETVAIGLDVYSGPNIDGGYTLVATTAAPASEETGQ